MKVQYTKVDIFNIASNTELNLFNEMVDNLGPTIQDWFKLENHYVVIRDDISNYYANEEIDNYHGLDVNVAISSAITAGGCLNLKITLITLFSTLILILLF